jgi:spore coat protein JA
MMEVAAPLQSQYRVFEVFAGPCDPCPPIRCKTYNTPPNLYLGYQPMCLPQFVPHEALRLGTLWPVLFSPYESRR